MNGVIVIIIIIIMLIDSHLSRGRKSNNLYPRGIPFELIKRVTIVPQNLNLESFAVRVFRTCTPSTILQEVSHV